MGVLASVVVALAGWVGNPEEVAVRGGAFVANRGQLDDQVRFAVALDGVDAFVTGDGFALTLKPGGGAGAHLRFRFAGASDSEPVGVGRRPYPHHYFKGDDPARWATHVPLFDSVFRPRVHPGVDVAFLAREGRFEYDLLARDGGAVAAMSIRVEGAGGLSLDPAGRLVIETAVGPLVQTPPRAYSLFEDGARRPLQSRFVLLGPDRFGFHVEPSTEAVVIDPGFDFKTFVGGSGWDTAAVVALDGASSVIVAGSSDSIDFPITPGAVDDTVVENRDVFLARISPDGASIHWATFLGGFANDDPHAVEVGPEGSIYVCGITGQGFPITPGAIDSVSSSHEGFITKVGPMGDLLVYSTFLGGTSSDWANDLAVDEKGHAYVTGVASNEFPTTPGTYSPTPTSSGSINAFLVKVVPDGSALAYGTYFGGSSALGFGVTCLPSGEAVVVGSTAVLGFPTTPGVVQDSGSGTDAFVARFTASASSLVYSTLLGGVMSVGSNSTDTGYAVEVDADSNVVVVGVAQTEDFPVTPGAWDTSLGIVDYFVASLSADATVLNYSTFLGGSSGEGPINHTLPDPTLVLDVLGRPHVFGHTISSDFPYSDDALLTGPGAFVARMTTTGQLDHATLVTAHGGSYRVGGAVDGDGDVYVVGGTHAEFVATPGVLGPSFHGGFVDGFIARLEIGCPGSIDAYDAGCPGSAGITPVLSGTGCPSPGCCPVFVELSDAYGGGHAVFLFGLGSTAVPVTPACSAQIGPVLGVSVTTPVFGSGPGEGFFTAIGSIPAGFTIADLHVQAFTTDPGAPFGVAASNPLRLTTQ